MSNDKIKRAPRIKSFSLQDVRFIQKGDEVFELDNLSSTGIGIRRKANDVWPEQNQSISGQLQIENHQVPLELSIKRKTGTSIGCSYAKDPIELKRLIHTLYDTEFSALELKRVTPKILREQPDGDPHWFFDGSGGELFFVEKNGQIKRYLIQFNNFHIDGITGKVPVIRADKEEGLEAVTMTPKVREQFLRFLNNIENLDAKYLEALTDILDSV